MLERGVDGNADHQTILLIEDDPDIARLIERELMGHRYRVECFETAQASLRRARRSDIALIVLDLLLPDMHGFEVCRQLRSEETTCAVPIVHKSGDVAQEFGNLAHWWKNDGRKPAVLISADLFTAGMKDEHM